DHVSAPLNDHVSAPLNDHISAPLNDHVSALVTEQSRTTPTEAEMPRREKGVVKKNAKINHYLKILD
ncbi:MAG: hypothetical protein ACK40K_00830, partial [Raineya sp.]